MRSRLNIILLIFLLFTSCGDDSIHNPVAIENPYVISVSSHIKMVREDYTIPDTDADVFLYFGVYSLDLLGYNLLEDGSFVRGDKVVSPKIHTKISENGESVIELEEIDEKICIVIRSKVIANNNIAIASFTNSRKQISFKHTFIVNSLDSFSLNKASK